MGGASQDCGTQQGPAPPRKAPLRAPASGSPRPRGRGSGGADLEGGGWRVQHATSSKVPTHGPRIPRRAWVPRRRSKEPPSRRGSRGSPSSRVSQGRGERRTASRPWGDTGCQAEAGRGKAAGPCASVTTATPSGLQGDRTVLGLPAPHAPRTHPRLRCSRPGCRRGLPCPPRRAVPDGKSTPPPLEGPVSAAPRGGVSTELIQN